MLAYDPDHAPDPSQWLAIDEQERIVLVEAFHRSAYVEFPSLAAHAVFHAMVENQIAYGATDRMQGRFRCKSSLHMTPFLRFF